jgi:hypothetical protein
MEKEWNALVDKLKGIVGKEATLDGFLFLIGVQELGKGFLTFSKEEKQDLMHIGTCKVLSLSGYYELEGVDLEGWPHWKLIKNIPSLTLEEQEKMLKMHVLEYFEKEEIT